MTTRPVKKLDFVKDYETVQVWNKKRAFHGGAGLLVPGQRPEIHGSSPEEGRLSPQGV